MLFGLMVKGGSTLSVVSVKEAILKIGGIIIPMLVKQSTEDQIILNTGRAIWKEITSAS